MTSKHAPRNNNKCSKIRGSFNHHYFAGNQILEYKLIQEKKNIRQTIRSCRDAIPFTETEEVREESRGSKKIPYKHTHTFPKFSISTQRNISNETNWRETK